MATDPLQLARDEYRKLLTRVKASEEECRTLRHVVASALCVANGDGCPEVLADHPLVEWVTSLVGPANEMATENGRLRGVLYTLLRRFEEGPALLPGDEGWLRLQHEIRSVLHHKGSAK